MKKLILSCMFVMLLACSTVFASPLESDDWEYIDDIYGSVYHYQYACRDDERHCHVVWTRQELPNKRVTPANGFRKICLQLVSLHLKSEQVTVYEEFWYDRDGKLVSHKRWDSNWRPAVLPQHKYIIKDLKSKGYR